MVRLHRFLALALPFAAFACTANATFSTGEPEPDPQCSPAQCGDGASGGAGPGTGGSGTGGSGTGGSGTCTTACAGAGGSGAGTGGAGTAGSGAAGSGTGGAAGSGGVIPPAGSGGAPPAGVNLRVVNFNAENLFDTVDGGGFGEGELTPTPAAYAAQIDDTAALLAMLRAEVIALEEIENREVVLNDLADKLGEKLGVGYPSRWLIKGNDPVRNVALISTLPIAPADVISHNNDGVDGRFDAFGNLQANGPFSFARDCLEVTLRYQGYPVTLFVVHYKAKSNDDPARRLAEARRTRKLVEARFQADPNARLVVLGDFNDTPESPPLQALTDVSPILTSGVSLLPAHLAWTHPFGNGPNNGQLIDDQLASPSMTAARRPDSITVWHDNDPGFPPALRPVSDHSPVAITYLLGDAPLGP